MSTLVNELLENETRIPLEFFIQGFPLRVSLEEWLTSHGVSTEDVIDIQYARAQLPPVYRSSYQHDDCIGALDILSPANLVDQSNAIRPGHERILSGSFDGSVRVWNTSGQTLATSEGAAAPDQSGNRRLADGRVPALLCAKFLSPSTVIASGSRSYLRIWNYHGDEGIAGEGVAKLTPSLDLHGHKMAVSDLDVDMATRRTLSASDDKTAMLWSTVGKEAPAVDSTLLPAANSNKRRKLSSPHTKTRGPLNTLFGHKDRVKGVTFHPADSSVAYSASTDSTVKTWDLETAQAVQSKTPGGPYTPHRCIYAMRESGLVVSGTSDRRILLMDPREDAVRQSVGTFQGHRNAVTALDGNPDNSNVICSASWDGCVRIWDIRAAQDPVAERRGSTYKIPRHWKGRDCDRIPGGEGVKLNCVRWDPHVGIVSGGEDKKLQIDQVTGKG